MDRQDQLQGVLNQLAEVLACHRCGTRIRFGDYECPHCGVDLEDDLRRWAEQLIDRLA